MLDYVAELRHCVERGTSALLSVSEAESERRPAPGKWSPREVIGHLIDSASNNHQRFVRAQFQDDLVFPGYAQEEWVAVQRYQEVSWAELVALWRLFNLHLGRVMAAVPERTRLAVRRRHNLHKIAWQTVPEDQPTTLDYFMRDYVGHLENHLRQVLGPRWNPSTGE